MTTVTLDIETCALLHTIQEHQDLAHTYNESLIDLRKAYDKIAELESTVDKLTDTLVAIENDDDTIPHWAQDFAGRRLNEIRRTT
jgi:hypothetical protein